MDYCIYTSHFVNIEQLSAIRDSGSDLKVILLVLEHSGDLRVACS